MTNRDMLNNKTNEELADVIELIDCIHNGYRCPGMDICAKSNVPNGCGCECKKYFIKWLESEVKDDKAE